MELLAAAREARTYLAAARKEGTRWPGFRMDIIPAAIIAGNWSVLLGAPPSEGFVPLQGTRCPCWQPSSLPAGLFNIPQVVQLHESAKRLDWVPGFIGSGSGNLVVQAVGWPSKIDGMAPADMLSHELFHWYQAGSGADPYHGSAPAPSREQGSVLLTEQLLLARAVRADPANRPSALGAWRAWREGMRKVGLPSAEGAKIELIEGTARYFDLQVAARVRGISRREEESRIASGLVAGGRDIDIGENWFAGNRYYETGAALCALLDDTGKPWRHDLLATGLAGALSKTMDHEDIKPPDVAKAQARPLPMNVKGPAADLVPPSLRIIIEAASSVARYGGIGNLEEAPMSLGSRKGGKSVGSGSEVIRQGQTWCRLAGERVIAQNVFTLEVFGDRAAELLRAALGPPGARTLDIDTPQLSFHGPVVVSEEPGQVRLKLPAEATAKPPASLTLPAFPASARTPWPPISIAVGDVNGDGRPDVVAGFSLQWQVGTFLNQGGGRLGPMTASTTLGPSCAVAAGDFEGHGRAGLVVGLCGDKDAWIEGMKHSGAQEDGAFAKSQLMFGPRGPSAAVAADFNGDGKLDVAVTGAVHDTLFVALNRGDGNFARILRACAVPSDPRIPSACYVTGNSPEALAVGDFNGDGKADIAVANGLGDSIGVFLNRGDGTFRDQVAYPVLRGPMSIAAVDLDGDGKLDLAVADFYGPDGHGAIDLLRGKGDGTFAPAGRIAVGPNPVSIATADLDGDGRPDLVVAENGGGQGETVTVHRNLGSFHFAPAERYTVGPLPNALAVADMDGDGHPDIVVATANGIVVLLNRGGGRFSAER